MTRLRRSPLAPSCSPRGEAPPGVATTDVLLAVMDVYGESFDRVLLAHGTDRDEVIARLGAGPLERGED